MRGNFFDAGVVLRLLDAGAEADLLARLMGGGGAVSVHVLDEVLDNCLGPAKMNWDEAAEFMAGICNICEVCDATQKTHEIGRMLGPKYGLSPYDAMIVAAAMQSGCERLYSDRLSHGLVVEGYLRVVNPFR